MKSPQRSVAIARSLAEEADGLPEEFAAQVAALAEAGDATRVSKWNEAALVMGFAAMIALCLVGWLQFATPEWGSLVWLEPLLSACRAQPWLGIGVGGVAIVHMLSFGRRMTR